MRVFLVKESQGGGTESTEEEVREEAFYGKKFEVRGSTFEVYR
jgi:hypothetical protein